MKILLTTHVFLPEFFGGTETLVHGVALALQQRGYQVMVVTGYPIENDLDAIDGFDEYEVDSIPILRFRHGRAHASRTGEVMRNDYANPVFEERFCQLLDEFMPNIVHFHHLERLSIKAIDACKARAIPAFLTATDFWYICPAHALLLPDGRICDGPTSHGANCLKHLTTLSQPRWLARIINYGVPMPALGAALSAMRHWSSDFKGMRGEVQALAKRGDAIAERLRYLKKVIVPTRHAQTTLENNGIKEVKFRVLPFGIKDYGYSKRGRDRNNAALVVGFIGSLLPHKGLHVLLQAMSRMPAYKQVMLKIYGRSNNGYDDYVRSLHTQADGDGRIVFCGTFENSSLPTVLDSIDVLVIPSLWHENMPLVSLAAQAAGCPLIASKTGGLVDIVEHEKTGLLFTPGSASELAQMIIRLISEPELLRNLSSSAVAPMNIDHYVDELESEYWNVLEG